MCFDVATNPSPGMGREQRLNEPVAMVCERRLKSAALGLVRIYSEIADCSKDGGFRTVQCPPLSPAGVPEPKALALGFEDVAVVRSS
jgi:hypothetical protein